MFYPFMTSYISNYLDHIMSIQRHTRLLRQKIYAHRKGVINSRGVTSATTLSLIVAGLYSREIVSSLQTNAHRIHVKLFLTDSNHFQDHFIGGTRRCIYAHSTRYINRSWCVLCEAKWLSNVDPEEKQSA